MLQGRSQPGESAGDGQTGSAGGDASDRSSRQEHFHSPWILICSLTPMFTGVLGSLCGPSVLVSWRGQCVQAKLRSLVYWGKFELGR